MATTTRMAAACLLMTFILSPAARAQERSRGFLFRLAERGQNKPKHQILPQRPVLQPGAPPVYEYQAVYMPPPATEAERVGATGSESAIAAVPESDPYGFAAILNQVRARAGLRPLIYDANLSAWASQNNAAQCRHGIGHHVNPHCLQNSAWNYTNAWEVVQGWLDSPGHRANMLSPSITHVGIAYGPGPYWTMNAR